MPPAKAALRPAPPLPLEQSAELTRRVQNVLANFFDLALEKMGNDPAGLALRMYKGKVSRMIAELDPLAALEMAGAICTVADAFRAPDTSGGKVVALPRAKK